MVKKLISFDESKALYAIRMVGQFAIPQISERILPIFQELEIGPLTSEHFKDLLDNEGKAVNEESLSTMEKALKANGIVKRVLRTQATQKQRETFYDLMFEVDKLKETLRAESQVLQYISFEDGEPVLSEADKIRIEESCKVYAASSLGLDLSDLHDQALKSINALYEKLNEAEASGIMLNQLFVKGINDVLYKKTEVDYDLLCEAATIRKANAAHQNTVNDEWAKQKEESGLHEASTVDAENPEEESELIEAETANSE